MDGNILMTGFAQVTGLTLADQLCCASILIVLAVFFVPPAITLVISFFALRSAVKSVYLTDAGDLVRSGYEERVADYLYTNRIGYQYEPMVATLLSRFRPDFYLRKERVFIEVWGMRDDKEYRKYMERKIRAYDGAGIDYISLYPENLGDIGGAIEREIRNLRGKKRKRFPVGFRIHFKGISPGFIVSIGRVINRLIYRLLGGRR